MEGYWQYFVESYLTFYCILFTVFELRLRCWVPLGHVEVKGGADISCWRQKAASARAAAC